MRRTTVLVSLLALVGTALSGAVLGSSQAADRDPGFGQPAIGSCYQMSSKELNRASFGEAAVDCTGKHTSQVIGVTYLPNRLSWKKASFTKIAAVAQRDCYPTLWAALGGSATLRAESAYRLAYFIPSKAQRKQGARWIRCDAILGVAKLSSMPASLVLTDPLADAVTACVTGRGGVVGCGKSHAHRAIGAVTLKGGYPSRREFLRTGSNKCRKQFPQKLSYLTWPSKPQWKLGNHAVTCYKKSSK
jgi:hypothetical protein